MIRYAVATAVAWAAIYLTLAATTLDFDVPYWMFQILPEEALRERWLESIWYLHAQPPLLNAAIGAALEVEEQMGVRAKTVLLLLHLLLGSAAAGGFAALAHRLLEARWLRVLVVAALLLDPCLWLAAFQAFYPFHEFVLLVLLSVFVMRFFDRGSTIAFAAASASAVALVLTRSLFHPLWAVLALAFVARGHWRRAPIRVSGVITLIALALWPAKNLGEFGFFGYSSWFGFHLSRGVGVEQPEIGRAFDFGESAESVAARAEARELVPSRYRDVPILVETVESPGIPNWNHFAMIGFGKTMLHRTVDAIAADPSRWLAKAWNGYRRGFALHPSRNVYDGTIDPRARGSWMEPWIAAHEAITVGPLGDVHATRRTVFRVAFPLAMLFVAWSVWRERASDPRWRLGAFVALNVTWVPVVALAVDGLEGNRMRLSTWPFFVLAVAWAVERIVARRHTTISSS